MDGVARGNLGQARERSVGALPEKLEVEGGPPLGPREVDDLRDPGGVADEVCRLRHRPLP
jgi:hypothetical protein